jgi:hypothetical protein
MIIMSEIITIDQLVKLLEKRPKDQSVSFDFCGFIPDDVDSYRGYYNELAISYVPYQGKSITVDTFLNMMMDVVGETYTGYKGGNYTMEKETNVWVDNYGRCSGTAVLGIEESDYITVIKTGYIDA